MLQYCVLYAKIQKLNMSNIMNKTNSDNEVYEESDLPTRPGAGGQGPSMQMFLPGLDCSELLSTKEKLQPPPLRQWQKEKPTMATGKIGNKCEIPSAKKGSWSPALFRFAPLWQ